MSGFSSFLIFISVIIGIIILVFLIYFYITLYHLITNANILINILIKDKLDTLNNTEKRVEKTFFIWYIWLEKVYLT